MKSLALRYIRGQIDKAEYLRVSLEELDVSRQCDGISGCGDFIKKRLSDAFWELDRLDRSNEFWNHTNHLPTISKLNDFANYQIKSNTNTVNGAWLKIICKLIFVSHHLESEAWRMLKENNELNVSFLVRTAWNVSDYWVEGEISIFCDLIRELDLQTDVLPELDALEKVSKEAAHWVSLVRKELAST